MKSIGFARVHFSPLFYQFFFSVEKCVRTKFTRMATCAFCIGSKKKMGGQRKKGALIRLSDCFVGIILLDEKYTLQSTERYGSTQQQRRQWPFKANISPHSTESRAEERTNVISECPAHLTLHSVQSMPRHVHSTV